MVTENAIPFTAEGLGELAAELKRLKEKERPQIIQDIAEARAHGDLSENAEYHAAREKQGFVEARINELESSLSRATVVDTAAQSADVVRFGAYVKLIDQETDEERLVRIVGDLEADIAQNKISLGSPLARALMGKQVDDLVQLVVPAGEKEYLITGIRY
jgi:transcription elongation factor GreA